MEYFFANGNEQRGPYTLEQLASLGLKPDTLVWHDGLPEWKAASALSELASLFASSQTAAPAAASPAATTPLPTPSLAYQSPYAASAGPNGMAIASLVLGIVSLVTMLCYFFGLIPGILAIIFGVLARKQIRQTNADGYGMATAGLICGSIAVGLVVLGFITIIIIRIAVHH